MRAARIADRSRNPARVADLLLVYAGALLVGQVGLVHGLAPSLGALGTLATGLVFWAFALHRRRLPADEIPPARFGPFLALLAGLCLVLTAVTVGLVLPGGP